MSDSTEQTLKPVTEAEKDATAPPRQAEDVSDADRDERAADDAQRGDG
jgi:hypothetical protein